MRDVQARKPLLIYLHAIVWQKVAPLLLHLETYRKIAVLYKWKTRRSELAQYTFEFLIGVLRYLKFSWILFSTSKSVPQIPFFEDDVYAGGAQ
jgi:hypothetical protein